MAEAYDALVSEHYRKVAEQEGLSPSSTMADQTIRRVETEAVVRFVETFAREVGGTPPLVVADVGCGNGYSLEIVSRHWPEHRYLGFELSPELRALARSRFVDRPQVTVAEGDIRHPGFAGESRVDLLTCQRVLINILDRDQQRRGLDNLVGTVREGGAMLFIESFDRGLENLNRARAELGLEPVPAAVHNLYLDESFFDHPFLEPCEGSSWGTPENVLSTHYFVARVLHPAILAGRPGTRNSEFVRFFSSALPPAIGDYAPIRIRAFRRRSDR